MKIELRIFSKLNHSSITITENFLRFMEIPCGNFFEVTINSNKLFQSIQQLHGKLSQQESKIKRNDIDIRSLEDSIWDKINHRLNDVTIELEKRKRANQEELNHFKLFLKDHDKKTEQKIQDFQSQISVLSAKMSTVKEAVEEDTCFKISYLQKKIQNIMNVQQIEDLMKQESQKTQFRMQKIAQKHSAELKNLEEKIQNSIRIKDTLLHKEINDLDAQEFNQMSVTFSQLPERRKSRSQTRKRVKTQRLGTIYQESSDVKLFMSKIQQLQNKLNKENQDTKLEPSVSGHEKKGRQATKQILDKLNKIADEYSSKLPQFQQKMQKINNRYEIINEHVGILNRKVDKQKSQITEIGQLVKHIDDKKIDDKVIENIKTSIKLLAKQFEEQIVSKLEREVFQKQKQRLNDRMSRLFGLIDDKCEKNQVKKGLTFLEEKIKDIIIVLAEEKNFVKDSAIKRIQAKCLSCDKELEPASNENIQNIHKSMRPTVSSNLTGRSSTSQLRKRIRVLHGSIVGEQFN